ncbi:glycosyltransferase, partial [Streptomyces sp. SID5998]|nr:glycosyltransferase [Streptomyces sp. SID5998]
MSAPSPPMSAPPLATVLVIAKEPVPGRVKTRLTPPYTPREAAALAEAALADTLHTVR